MEVKKCARCGSFLASYDNICVPCSTKDKVDVQKLRTYFEDNSNTCSIEQLSINTGITQKNLSRHMQSNDFSGYLSGDNQDISNISISL